MWGGRLRICQGMPCLLCLVRCSMVLCSYGAVLCLLHTEQYRTQRPSISKGGHVSPLRLLGFLTVTRLERVQRREARGVDGQSRPKFLGLGAAAQRNQAQTPH